MPKAGKQTSDGREVHQSASQGCAWQCITCGVRLRERQDVRGHWAAHSVGHSVFRNLTAGTVHHQTIEGLHQRSWQSE